MKSRDRFYSSDGKRQVLVVDDEEINRELLGMILESDYHVLFAENGREAMDILLEKQRQISLVMLDLMMPVMDGFELIESIKNEDSLSDIPLIVLTSEKAAEVKSLRLGAADFIPKPYDLPEVILARVQRIIEMYEDRTILSNTERDDLTGLLRPAFFFRYAEQYDIHHPDAEMDMVYLDIEHFHIINEMYGWDYGDGILRKIAEMLMEFVRENGGLAGYQNSGDYSLYCPSASDYEGLLASIEQKLSNEKFSPRLHFRVGVYARPDRSLDIEQRFDRAKQASDTIRNNYAKSVAYYDHALHEKALQSAQLIDEMEEALSQRQFLVYYQPKFDIRGDKYVLSSAEALIRWQHPTRGMVSPGVFIPLFEERGLIQHLDRYVWKEVAEQIRRWKEAYGVSIPVSVNVSRVDMFAPDLVPYLRRLIDENGLEPYNYLLEVTESAYTEDAQQVINTLNGLRAQGFRIEMDDFGSGYSSLNMLTQLPIDALKLDMVFMRTLPQDPKTREVLQLIINIAHYLNVPVVAEGVEKEEQLLALKDMNCDLIQGYYFSKPLPPKEFETFFKEGAHRADR